MCRLEHRLDGAAMDELDGEIELALDAAEVEDLGDVGMAQGRGDVGLVDERLDQLWVCPQVGKNALEHHRHCARTRVPPYRLPGDAHTAVADAREQSVGAEVSVVRLGHDRSLRA